MGSLYGPVMQRFRAGETHGSCFEGNSGKLYLGPCSLTLRRNLRIVTIRSLSQEADAFGFSVFGYRFIVPESEYSSFHTHCPLPEISIQHFRLTPHCLLPNQHSAFLTICRLSAAISIQLRKIPLDTPFSKGEVIRIRSRFRYR